MKRSLLSTLWLPAMAFLLSCISPNISYGFGEDLCTLVLPNAPRKGHIHNCFDLHCNDNMEFGTFKSIRCSGKRISKAVAATANLLPIRGRSMVHFDVTYVIGQVLGFSARNAYWLAAYNQAVDQSSYKAFDRAGNDLPQYSTVDLPGVVRTNLKAGGTFFHYVSPIRPHAIHDTSFLQSESEAPLHHIKDWAFGAQDILCRFGLTAAFFSRGSQCLLQLPGKEMISFKFPFTSSDDSPGILTEVTSGPVEISPSPLPERDLPLIKLAIYLHSLTDRISHHDCLDSSPILPGAEGKFFIQFAPACTQGAHLALHALEVGHPQLPPRTQIAIELAYDAIEEWLQRYPDFRQQRASSVTAGREELIHDILNALRPAEAVDRLNQFHKLWDRYEICGLPGDEARRGKCFSQL